MKNANPVSRLAGLGFAALLVLAACGQRTPETTRAIATLPAEATAPAARYTYEVVRAWPHDPNAFTQGLLFRNGSLLESTGLYGRSSLREVELATGRVLKQFSVPRDYFAEGLAVIGDRAYQLTWQHERGFIYDADTFRRLREFSYEGEGWGLATDGKVLALSDGTDRIRFLDPDTFAVVRSVTVTLDGRSLDRLNELEWIGGEIFANVWQTDLVVRIDPDTGRVRGVIDFANLLPAAERGPETDVLNGIAYDPQGDRLFVTGKQWPKLYEVRIKPRP